MLSKAQCLSKKVTKYRGNIKENFAKLFRPLQDYPNMPIMSMQEAEKLLQSIRMKIGIYDPYLDDHGGGEKYMMTIAACLSTDHAVTVFWDNTSDIEIIAKRFNLNLDKVTLKKNIFAKNISILERFTATNNYDSLIILSDGSIPLTLSKKLYLTVQQPLPATLKKSLIRDFKVSRVTKVFYNSQFTRDKNIGLFPESKIEVIYPPVTPISADVKKENIILHVGRYRRASGLAGDFKKQNIMLQVFIEMVDKGLKDWKFIIAAGVKGEDSHSFAQLKQKAINYPVTFMENISNKELISLYAKAKIYWHASGYDEDLEKNPELAEHFGISTVEAMSAGVVPIVINAGGQREIVTDGKNGLVWDSLEDLQKKTIKVMNDAELWNTLSKEARRRSADFSPEVYCDQIYNLIKK